MIGPRGILTASTVGSTNRIAKSSRRQRTPGGSTCGAPGGSITRLQVRVAAVVLAGCATSSLAGCGASPIADAGAGDASATDCARVRCPAGQTCREGACLLVDPCANVECVEEQTVCSYGSCVHRQLDEDGDGSPVSDDCDDHDPSVTAGSTRECTTVCGEGQVTCAGGRWTACSAPAECSCTPGDVREEPCGRCGRQTRTCIDSGTWAVSPSGCSGEGPCAAGSVEVGPCDVGGACSTRTRLCDASCSPGPWSDCEVRTECDPGEVDAQGCGRCGSATRTCGPTCLWGPFGDCGGQGECTPAELVEEPCGNCGVRNRTCRDDCSWSDWSGCDGEGDCAPGDVESQACGRCGRMERSCGEECRWGEWGGCSGELPNACQPGETEQRECGSCGTETRTCLDDCLWSELGPCGENLACTCFDGKGNPYSCCCVEGYGG